MKNMNINGSVAPEFQAVADAFAKNFAEEDEVGASICVIKDGTKVVDLWAGHKDAARNNPWSEDTIANVWSTTKGAMASCVAHLVARGRLDFEAKVASYWPEFAASGKQDITIAQLFSHQGGLCGLAESISVDQMFEVNSLANLLAAETPHWQPGSRSGYHALSIGYLAEGLFSRVVGETVGEYFKKHIAEPLELEFYMGMDGEENQHAAEMMHDGLPMSGGAENYNEYEVLALTNLPIAYHYANEKRWQKMGIPSAGAAASARGIAMLYRGLLTDLSGETVNIADAVVLNNALSCQIDNQDLVLGTDMTWGVGFALNGNSGMYGPNATAFGHHGWGGSFGFADPTAGISAGYSMNYMREPLSGDKRAVNLISAIYLAGEAAND